MRLTEQLQTLLKWIQRAVHRLRTSQLLILDYPIRPQPRYTKNNPHPELEKIVAQNRPLYQEYLTKVLAYQSHLRRIKSTPPLDETKPHWQNGFIPGLDAVALYSMLACHNPAQYLEIGSGNSTKFAHLAINDHQLKTRVTSIDPLPRAEINQICDQVVRQRLEATDLTIFEQLNYGDILFIDSSHRVFTNSDVTVIFLEILPRLKPGVLVEIHDIYLPYDYPDEWNKRYYSEQYLLAAYLLGAQARVEIILPNYYISRDPQLSQILNPLWQQPEMAGVETHGGSFWLRIKS